MIPPVDLVMDVARLEEIVKDEVCYFQENRWRFSYITCEQCKTTEVHGRRITFSQGLNDNRGKVLSGKMTQRPPRCQTG